MFSPARQLAGENRSNLFPQNQCRMQPEKHVASEFAAENMLVNWKASFSRMQ